MKIQESFKWWARFSAIALAQQRIKGKSKISPNPEKSGPVRNSHRPTLKRKFKNSIN